MDERDPFFDRYPVFYGSGDGSSRNVYPWMNARYDVLIRRNLDLISGKRLIDLGSNDGRWTLASIENGARHVTGIEWASHLVKESEYNLRSLGVDDSRYSFTADDLNSFLMGDRAPIIDTALVLGVLYLQSNHLGLFRRLSDLGAKAMIIDTSVSMLFPAGEGQPMVMELWKNWYLDQDVENGMPRHMQVAARPTVSALRFILDMVGYDMEEIDWKPYLDIWDDGSDGLAMYRNGERRSFVARKRYE